MGVSQSTKSKKGLAPSSPEAATGSGNIKCQEIIEINECCEETEENSGTDKCVSDHERYINIADLDLAKLPESIQSPALLEYIHTLAKLPVLIRVGEVSDRRPPPKEGETVRSNSHTGSGYSSICSDQIEKHAVCPIKNCSYNNGAPHESYSGIVVHTNHHVIFDRFEAEHSEVEFFYDEKPKPRMIPQSELPWLVNCPASNKSAQGDEPNPDQQKGVCSSTSQLDLGQTTADSHEKDGSTGKDFPPVPLPGDNSAGQVKDLQDFDTLPDQAKTSSSQMSSSNFSTAQEANTAGNDPSYDKSGNKAYGYFLREVSENKDLVSLHLVFHNPDLYNVVKRSWSDSLTIWSRLEHGDSSRSLKKELKNHVIVISHPHGQHKRISFGNLLQHEKEVVESKDGRKMTSYNATTCKGSSGAPVFTGYYAYKPFVHSSKVLKEETLYNVSYSY